MRVLFVMNPASGPGKSDPVPEIEAECKNQNIEFKIVTTTGHNDDQVLKKEIEIFEPDRIAACGGDGTVQLVARNLINSKIPMGILPLGSANGLATALALPKNVKEALNVFLNSGHTVPLDLLRINDNHICTHLADIGTNALLVKNYEEAGDKGILGYAKHLISSIQQSEVMQFEIQADKESSQKAGYMLMIANAHKYGTGVQISEGSVSDGRFEICNVQSIDLESAIKAGLTAINIFIDKDMFKDVISCKTATIKVNPPAHLQIDGEYIGEASELNVKMISAAIQAIIQ